MIPKLANKGLVIYKDFWVDKPPIMFFLIQIGQKLFGATILGSFIWYNLIVSFVAFLIFKVTEAYTQKPKIGLWAAIFWVVFSSLPLAELFWIMSEPYVILFGLLAIWFFLKSQRRKNFSFLADGKQFSQINLPSTNEKLELILSVFFLILTPLVRPTGIVFILAFIIFIFARRQSFLVKELKYIFYGMLIGLSALFFYLWFFSDISGFFYQVYLERLWFLDQSATSRMAYKPDWFLNYFWSSLPLWVLTIPVFIFFKRNRWLVLFFGWLFFTTVFYFFFSFAPGYGHEYAETIAPLSILAAFGLDQLKYRGSEKWRSLFRVLLVVAIIVSFSFNYYRGEWRDNDIPTLNEITSYLKEKNLSGENLFVLETKHAKISPWIYFLNGGPPFLEKRLSFVVPVRGLTQDEADVLIGKLKGRKVENVLTIGGQPPQYPEFAPVNRLYDEIVANFRLEKVFDSYSPYPGKLDYLPVELFSKLDPKEYQKTTTINLSAFSGATIEADQGRLTAKYLPLVDYTLFQELKSPQNFSDVFFDFDYHLSMTEFYLDLVDSFGNYSRKVIKPKPGTNHFRIYVSAKSLTQISDKSTDFNRISQINFVIPKIAGNADKTVQINDFKILSR